LCITHLIYLLCIYITNQRIDNFLLTLLFAQFSMIEYGLYSSLFLLRFPLKLFFVFWLILLFAQFSIIEYGFYSSLFLLRFFFKLLFFLFLFLGEGEGGRGHKWNEIHCNTKGAQVQANGHQQPPTTYPFYYYYIFGKFQ